MSNPTPTRGPVLRAPKRVNLYIELRTLKALDVLREKHPELVGASRSKLIRAAIHEFVVRELQKLRAAQATPPPAEDANDAVH